MKQESGLIKESTKISFQWHFKPWPNRSRGMISWNLVNSLWTNIFSSYGIFLDRCVESLVCLALKTLCASLICHLLEVPFIQKKWMIWKILFHTSDKCDIRWWTKRECSPTILYYALEDRANQNTGKLKCVFDVITSNLPITHRIYLSHSCIYFFGYLLLYFFSLFN